MLHIPILRAGRPYESVEKTTLVHHATGQPVADISQANSGLLRRDILGMADDTLEDFPVARLLAICKKAADVFMTARLPIGDETQTLEDYFRQVSATTGMPLVYCRRNAEKIHKVLFEMEAILRGLTRGFDLAILDRGFGHHEGGTLSWFREGRLFGAVLPSNSPGVHGLWIPALALKAPLVLKPGREEPWTPWRIIQALIAAGAPSAAFGFYPTDHGGAAELLRSVSRAMLFGDAATTRPWQHDPRVQIHGPGVSKIVLGDDQADDWARHVDVMVSSIVANGGRSCLNCSAVFTPRHGERIAAALAAKLAAVEALPADHPEAQIAAFANAEGAERISAAIDAALHQDVAVDLTAKHRGSPRLVQRGRTAWLLPTVVWAGSNVEASCIREFPFPYAVVVECPPQRLAEAIGPTLVLTAITQDAPFKKSLMRCSHVDRLNFGPLPTWQISWDQPHEGNLFEHLYRQRAFQAESAA